MAFAGPTIRVSHQKPPKGVTNHRQVVERSGTPAYSLLPLQDLLPKYPHSELTSFLSGTGYGRTHEEPLGITTHNKMYERKRDYNIKDL